jgi:hypothetical protein
LPIFQIDFRCRLLLLLTINAVPVRRNLEMRGTELVVRRSSRAVSFPTPKNTKEFL